MKGLTYSSPDLGQRWVGFGFFFLAFKGGFVANFL